MEMGLYTVPKGRENKGNLTVNNLAEMFSVKQEPIKSSRSVCANWNGAEKSGKTVRKLGMIGWTITMQTCYFYRSFFQELCLRSHLKQPMRFFERLFGLPATNKPDITFGRYTDAYKTATQLQAWENAVQQFDQSNILQSYLDFFVYLKDPNADNFRWQENQQGELTFEFSQGSRLIEGIVSEKKFKVESFIAQANDLNVGFLRRLMEYNFNLKFCRFALSPQNYITILFDSHSTDASPLKLLQALRELAIHADKQDDLLLDEFRSLRTVEPLQIIAIPDEEKEVKYQFLRSEIENAFAIIDAAKPDPNQYPGGYAFLILGLAFRIDYLLRPEGYTMDVLERLHGTYFTKDERTPQNKIIAMRKSLQQLLERPREAVFAELYRTHSTFGINPPVNHERIAALIDVELPNMDWHLQQNHEALAMAVPQYIVGYALFHFAPPLPDREFFHLFFEITHPAFFAALRFDTPYADAQGRPDRRAVIEAIRNIAAANKKLFPHIKPDVSQLDFSSMPLFARSYLFMIKDLQLTQAP